MSYFWSAGTNITWRWSSFSSFHAIIAMIIFLLSSFWTIIYEGLFCPFPQYNIYNYCFDLREYEGMPSSLLWSKQNIPHSILNKQMVRLNIV